MKRRTTFLTAVALFSWAFLGSPLRGDEAAREPLEGELREAKSRERLLRLARDLGTNDVADVYRRAAEAYDKETRTLEKLGRTTHAGPTWTSLGPTNSPTYALPIGSAPAGADDTGLITAIAPHPTDPRTIVVGSAGGGIWKTTDAGAHWTAVAENLGVGTIQIGAVDYAPSNPRRMYAGTGCGDTSTAKTGSPSGDIRVGIGLLVSNDGGDTWTPATGPSPADFFWAIDVDPTSPDTLLVAGNRGLQRSTDGGQTFTAVITPNMALEAVGLTPGSVAELHATSISRNGQVLFAAVWLQENIPGLIYRSNDGGRTFLPLPSAGLPGDLPTRGRIQVAVAPNDADSVYALLGTQSLKQAGFARSSDGGASWSTVDLGSTDLLGTQSNFATVLAIDPKSPSTIYAGGLDMYRSTDSGTTFKQISDWRFTTVPSRPLPYLHSDQHAVVFGADGSVYYGNDGGIYVGTSTGFRSLNPQILSFLVDDVCSNANASVIMAGAQDNGTALRGEGGVWVQVGGADGYGCLVSPASDRILTLSGQTENIFVSQDGGKSIADADGITEAGGPNALFRTILVQHPTQTNHIFTATKHKL